MELKEQDIKLLAYLYHHNREPISKIAKACKLSREQVEYKIKKYQSEGIIKGFLSVYNYPALGYNIFITLLLKIKTPCIEKLSAKLNNDKNCISKSEIFGDYDFFVNLIFKDENELNKYISDFLKENHKIILNYKIIKPFFSEMYPLKIINHKDKQPYNIMELTAKEILLDNKEKLILKLLEKDARIRLIDIAKKLEISAVLTLHKLKKLYKNRIILGSKIHFDIKKLGYFYSVIQFDIDNFSIENQEKIKKFAKEHKIVNSVILSINRPNCIIQIFNKSQEELMNIIREIKNFLSEDIKNMSIMFPQQEEEVNALPFLK